MNVASTPAGGPRHICVLPMIGDRQPLQMKKTPFDVDTDFQRAFDMI